MAQSSSTPMRKRIALAVVVLHAVVLWLLVLVSRARGPEQAPPEPPQFVSAWIQAYAPPAQATPAAPSPQAAGVPRTVTAPRKPVATTPPVPPLQAPAPVAPDAPTATPAAPAPPVDWSQQSLLAAQRAAAAAAAAGQHDTFSPPPKVIPGTCKPRQGSMEWKGEEDRAVTMDGIFPVFRMGKRCVIVLVLPYCVLNKLPEANQHLLDDMNDPQRSHSSVPDPNVCD